MNSRLIVALLLVVVLIASLPAARIAAQEPAEDPTDINQLFVLPEGDDVPKLARFLQRLVEFQPGSRDDVQVYKRKAPLAMRKAAEKIVALEKDTKSKHYRLAKRHLLSEQAGKLAE